jgi:hypothetical protein
MGVRKDFHVNEMWNISQLKYVKFATKMLPMDQWFWRRFLNDPTPFLHFCDYLPFEEDLALYLKKLEFPSPKDNLYQV